MNIEHRIDWSKPDRDTAQATCTHCGMTLVVDLRVVEDRASLERFRRTHEKNPHP